MVGHNLLKSCLPAAVLDRLLPMRFRPRRVPGFARYREAVAGRLALEVGGPSLAFKTIVPIYPCLAHVDGANFANYTVWEGSVTAGTYFSYFGRRTGQQYVLEATHLAGIADGQYECLISAHCLEHVANPLKALLEWRRVMQKGAPLVLMLPNKSKNFDHRRPDTQFEHLLKDFEQDVNETDLTHLDEIMRLHDLELDPGAGTWDDFERRSRENFFNRTLHHHVFSESLIRSVLSHTGFEILELGLADGDWCVLARR